MTKETKTQAQQANYDQLKKLSAEDAKQDRERAEKEAEGRRVKQGQENADDSKGDPSGPPYTTKREDQGDTTAVLDADGKPVEVNVEAANTTATLARQGALEENPATRALREQDMRRAAGSHVVNADVAAAAEQARQNEVVPADGGQDDKDHKGEKK